MICKKLIDKLHEIIVTSKYRVGMKESSSFDTNIVPGL